MMILYWLDPLNHENELKTGCEVFGLHLPSLSLDKDSLYLTIITILWLIWRLGQQFTMQIWYCFLEWLEIPEYLSKIHYQLVMYVNKRYKNKQRLIQYLLLGGKLSFLWNQVNIQLFCQIHFFLLKVLWKIYHLRMISW